MDLNLQSLFNKYSPYLSNFFFNRNEPLYNKGFVGVCCLTGLYLLHQIEYILKSLILFFLTGKLGIFLLALIFLAAYLHRKNIQNFFKNFQLKTVNELLLDPMFTNAAVFMLFAAFFMLAYAQLSSYAASTSPNETTEPKIYPARVYINPQNNETLLKFDEFNKNLQSLIKTLNKKFDQRKKTGSNLTDFKNATNYTTKTVPGAKLDHLNYVDNETLVLFDLLQFSLPLFIQTEQQFEQKQQQKPNYFIKYELKFKTVFEFLKFFIRAVFSGVFLLVGFYLVVKMFLTNDFEAFEVNDLVVDSKESKIATVCSETSCQVDEAELSVDYSKKNSSYIKNTASKTSPSRLSIKSKNKKLSLEQQQQQQQHENLISSYESNSLLNTAEDALNDGEVEDVELLGLEAKFKPLNSSLDEFQNVKLDDGDLLLVMESSRISEPPVEFSEPQSPQTPPPQTPINIHDLPEHILNALYENNVVHSQAFTDLLNWLLFTDLDNFSAKNGPDYAGLLNWIIEDYLNSAQQKYDDLHFKSVDTKPPKFTNIQTVTNSTDNLTLKANLEFSDVDMKVEFKKSQRQLDLRLVNVCAQVVIVLSQNRNHMFNIECSLDAQSELYIEIRKDQSIEPALMQNFEALMKSAAKQVLLSLELNFFTKKISANSRNLNNHLHNIQQQQQQGISPHQSSININNTSNSMSNIGVSSSSPIESKRAVSSESPKLVVNDASLPTATTAQLMRNSINEKRLLVKLIKATNLTNCEEPYCVVELDYPMQKHLTDVLKDMSTINEQFLFDIIANSEELTFSIYDRAKDYGNDLIGEAVLPVNDLCSSISSKRVIQLHRFGQTKTGSITAEFVFIEPTSTKFENKGNRNSTISRNSRAPYDPSQSPPSTSSYILYRDDLKPAQNDANKLNVLNQVDNLSTSSFTTTPIQGSFQSSTLRSSSYTSTPFNNNNRISDTTQPNTFNYSFKQQPQQQQVPAQPQQSSAQLRNESPTRPQSQIQMGTTRVISRNYLQMQPNGNNSSINNVANTKSATLNSTGLDNLLSSANSTSPNSSEAKRTRSISRSLRSLFNRPSSVSKAGPQRRDKSYDSPSMYNDQYDIQSADVDMEPKKARSIGGSLKKMFTIKRNKKYEGRVHEPPRAVSPPNSSLSASRAAPDQMTSSNQMYQAAGQFAHQSLKDGMPQDNLTTNSASTGLLKRDYRSP